MDIEIPSGLQWLAYLAGSQWPNGSETAMWRIAGYWRSAAGELEALIPELQRVRSETQAVLTGETAQAADQQFHMLFDGDYSVDKLVDAMKALGDLADNLGTEIQYTKLQIITTLAIAAYSIYWAIANADWTGGASLAEIPVAEEVAEQSIGQLVKLALARIERYLASKLGSTLVARLLVEGAVSAGVGAGIGAGQELGIEGFQVLEGHRDGIDAGRVLDSAFTMGVAGITGALVGHGVGALLGKEGSLPIRVLKGAVTGLSSAEAANVAATLAGGGDVGAATILGGAIGFVHGGAHGTGGHATPARGSTDGGVPHGAIDDANALRFEKGPDGVFYWTGETSGGDGAARSSSAGAFEDAAANGGAPPNLLVFERGDGNFSWADDPSGSTPQASTAAREAAAGEARANSGAPPANRPSSPTAAVEPAAGGRAALPKGSAGASDVVARPTSGPPAVVDARTVAADRVTTSTDPTSDQVSTSLKTGPPEGTLNLSTTPPVAYAGPVTDTPGLVVSDPVVQSGAAPTPAVAPPTPGQESTPAVPPDRGPATGQPSPARIVQAGLPESEAGESASPPLGTPAAQITETTAGQAVSAPHDPTVVLTTSEQAGTTSERPGHAAAGPRGPDGTTPGRAEGIPPGGEGGRSPSPGTTRRDSTRPEGPAGARPGKPGPLRRSGVTPDPLAAADAVGVVGARHDEGRSGLGEGSSHGPEGVPPGPHGEGHALAAVADDALAQRVPPVRAEDLVHPLGDPRLAEERARANALWWDGLSGDQRQALIRTHPDEIGNAEGVPTLARHEANSLVVQRYLRERDELQAKHYDGMRLNDDQRAFIARMRGLEVMLGAAERAAQKAKVGGPYLLAFDPFEFGGDGRAIVSFGADPYRADSVSWNVPGLMTTIDQLDLYMHQALNHLESTLREEPGLSAASIAYVGYDAPNDSASWRVAGQKLARVGGEILYSDIKAFNAARDAWAGDGSHFNGNHLFGHSYGSTTVGFAGREGRLGSEVRTVTLMGSPGVGPIQHARDFGVGNNVFVAASSRDAVAALGGRVEGSAGRIFGRGLGVDPAMDFFGAQRVTSEFPTAMDHRHYGSGGTHSLYRAPVGMRDGVPVRSESLANFGRIAAGHPERVDHEGHRTLVDRPGNRFRLRSQQQTHEPAVGRPQHLADNPDAHPSVEHRNPWNPRWHTDPAAHRQPLSDCAYRVADELSVMYGRDFHVDAEPTPQGVPARALFEAAGSGADFATYDQVREKLVELGPGSSAIVVSRWADGSGRAGGHAYLAVNEDGEIKFVDPQTGERFGWPPSWGQDAVSRTAVGYLYPNGDPERPLEDGPHGLAAADEIGDVQGPGDEGRAEGLAAIADEAVMRLPLPERTGEVTTPRDAADRASERARAHAAWWDGLSEDQRRAVIQTYPEHIGATDGIPAIARHEANSLSFQHFLEDRDELQSRLDGGARLTAEEAATVAFYDQLEAALNRAADAASEAGVGGPYLLEFDPDAFDGNGRVIVSFGEDPYRADSVSWHIPGRGVTIDELGPCMGYALNHLASTLAEDPQLSAASIAWIGHETEGEDAARAGGEILYNDLRVFNAVHDETTADSSHFSNNQVFGHCQGSTVTGYAGEGGRLGNEVRTITLMGSPGAGPIEHASAFGVGDNVFVASSSRDPFTEHGGHVPGSMGGVLLGADPAMDFFGAQRVTSEFPRGTDPLVLHNSYYKFVDKSVGQRSESLTNLGRIGAGHPERVALEGRRTLVDLPGQQPHVLDPAAGRPVESITGDDVAGLASDALSQRVSPLQIHELLNPLNDARAAGERALANAAWWDGLSTQQQRALIETYPDKIGNAEGIPVSARHEANSRSLADWLNYRDQLQSKLDSGESLTAQEERDLDRLTEFEAALQEADDAASRAGVGGPYLLAFDPLAFGGEGRAIVALGEDPYRADSVSWHVPGRGMTLDGLGPFMDDALNHLESIRREDPTVSAASIAWVGYDTLAEGNPARAGGEILYSDIHAFNSARDAWAADGGHFSGNHVFGHSHGATVAGYAGQDSRLANDVDTITLIAPAGAGPVLHASEFGIGDNVYVAASSHDSLIAGADGVDPAMNFFGAQRVTAEYPRGAEPLDAYRAYYQFADETTGQRNEALANLGRIAAGHPERVALEEHRTVVHDPAAERAVQLEDPAPTQAQPAKNCAYAVADELSEMYGREFHVEAEPTETGVPARALFEAAGSDADFATYDQVRDKLVELGPGSSAILVSRWAGDDGRQGGHAYLAVNEDGEIKLVDPQTGERSGWPPSWGEDAVSRTAVGYLYPNGDPERPLEDTPGQLAAADTIGDVAGQRDDPDFLRRQEQYRAQNLTTRRVDTRYAERVGDVLDNVSDPAKVQQLAEDLSGKYGPYRIELRGRELNGEIMLVGEIFRGDTHIGEIQREFGRDDDGNLVAYHTGLSIDDSKYRGHGFSKALTSELERYYIGSGVDRIELGSHGQGSYAWARRGFTWDPDPESLRKSLDSIKSSARELLPWVSGDAQEVLQEVIERLEPEHPRLPELVDLASLSAPGEPELGRQLLNETRVNFVKYLRDAVAEETVEQSDKGFRAWLQRQFGIGDDQSHRDGVPTETRTDPHVAALANEALAQRIPPVGVDELVNPLGDEAAAVERARANVAWWDGLTDEQQHALIEAHPDKIGNAEGIPAWARHEANTRLFEERLANRDRLQSKRAHGEHLNRAERRELARTNRLERALNEAREGARKAGVPGPYLLAFDPDAFDGHGRALVSFGEDPYRAASVSWYLDGLGMPIDRMHLYLRNALGQLESTLREEPGLSAASIAYIGYETPHGLRSWRVAGTKFARVGGQILFSDIRAFNAAHDAWAGDGSHFSGNHVFALSYGSTTTGYAGEGGRLATEVRTVSLLGSPGVGPIQHASGFGIGADNVFVASSSRDGVTQLGGATRGSIGRILGRGLGADPAMDFFGAQRVTAEFPTAMDRYPIPGVHMSYHHYVDRGADPPVRTESLANFGRIAAGHPERVDHEEHRSVVHRWGRLPRTHEPAVGRPLRIGDDPETRHSNDRRWWDPRWHTGPVSAEPPQPGIADPSAQPPGGPEPSGDPYLADGESAGDSLDRVAGELSSKYDHDIHVDSDPAAAPVPPGKLFEAVGSDRLFATYGEVGDTLRYLGPDSSAIVASDWSDRPGTDVVLAVNIGGTVHYYDPLGRPLDWPPPRGEGAVSRMAVGYLDANGDSLVPLDEYNDRYLDIWQQENRALAAISEDDRVQLEDEKDSLRGDFASALERGIVPGSDEANALAERDLALRQRLASDYGYEIHRYDARRLVTDGEFRDPYETVAPGLARYARDVIVANAEPHLQPPDDPGNAPGGPETIGPGENAVEEFEWEETAENQQPGFDARRELANSALDQRAPVVPPKELVNPLGHVERAVARARENVVWMARLSSGDIERTRAEIDALVESHPREIGNALGIPEDVSDKANRLWLERAGIHADRLRSQRLNAGERRFVGRVDRIDAWRRAVDEFVEEAGLPPPRWLAFDPMAFRGDGRAVIVIGDDPYRAEKVSWHIGRQKIDQLGETLMSPVLDRLRSDQETGSAAAVIWIGNNSGRPVGAARDTFFSDRAAFRAARAALAETGEAGPLIENRVYALHAPSTEGAAAEAGELWLHPDADPLLFAHRGAKDVRPENTWAAFQLGMEQGATALECDVHLTKDGHLVVIHDPWVNRTSDGRGFVTRKTLSELRELDFGGWHPSRTLGDAQGHTGILTLDELLGRLKDYDRPVTLFIETKHLQDYKYQVERNLVTLLERHGLADPAPTDRVRAAVHSSHPDALALVHRLAPEVPTVLLAPPLHSAREVSGYLWAAKRAHADAISFYKTLRAFPEAVDLATRQGLTVWAGVVHDPIEAQYVTDLGVGVIGSNHPALTSAWLGRGLTESALDQRVPVVPAKELVNPLGDTERAVARARENAAWMAGISPDGAEQRHAVDVLIESHPRQIGNAWGIPAEDSDKANRLVLQQAQDRADEYRHDPRHRTAVQRVDRIAAWMADVDRAVAQAGLRPPRLVAFDPMGLRHNGHAVIVIGDDPYRPDTKVSWHIARQKLDQLGENLVRPALDQLRLDQQEGPAAAVIWVGKNPLALGASRNAFYSDYAAFRAAREVWAATGDVEPHPENRVYTLGATSTTDPEGSSRTNPLWVPRDAAPRVTAHRGGPFDRPEQTVAAYEEALRQGADAFEGDAQLTKDNQLVLLHGRSVSHSSDGEGMVDKRTLAELRELDFGIHHPSRALGEAQGDTRIMTVEQMLQFVGDHDRPLTAVIETKHWRVGRDYFELEHQLVALLQRYGFADPSPGEQPPAVVLSFWPESLKVIRRLAPELPTVYHAPKLETAPWAAVVASHRIAKAVGANGIDHYVETLRAYPEAVDLAARQGLTVWAREKDQRDAEYLRGLGVSWIGTDHPGRLKYWLERGAATSDQE